MSFQDVKRHERVLNAYYQVEEANMLNDPNYMTLWKRHNYGENKKFSFQGLGAWRGMNMQITEDRSIKSSHCGRLILISENPLMNFFFFNVGGP